MAMPSKLETSANAAIVLASAAILFNLAWSVRSGRPDAFSVPSAERLLQVDGLIDRSFVRYAHSGA